MNCFTLAFSVALLAVPLPVAAQTQPLLTPQTTVQDERDLRASILSGCSLKAWQFAVRIMPSGSVVPSLSPTVLAQQKRCVYHLINDYVVDHS